MLGWLAHPVTVVATALLLVNDHVLKARWPGLVTGKLSDFAGLVCAPAVLAVLVALLVPVASRRVVGGFALAATATVFTWVKLGSSGAAVASDAWSIVNGPSLIRADTTDLLALPAIALSWWAYRSGTRHPLDGARIVRVVVLLPIALFSTVATSAAEYPETMWTGHINGELVVGNGELRDYNYRSGGPQARPVVFSATSDGGQTFHAWAPPRGSTGTPSPSVTATESYGFVIPSPLPAAHFQECIGPACFRVVPGELRVESSDDGGVTWRTAWSVSGPQYRALAQEYSQLGDPRRHLSSVCLSMEAVNGGYVVLVANGRDGVARRDVSGHWTRLDTNFAKAREPALAPDDSGGLYYAGRGPLVAFAVLLAFAAGVGFAFGVTAAPGMMSIRWRILLASVPVAAFVDLAAIAMRGAALSVTALCVSGIACAGLLIGLLGLPRRRARLLSAAVAMVSASAAGGAAVFDIAAKSRLDRWTINTLLSAALIAVVITIATVASATCSLLVRQGAKRYPMPGSVRR
jgi:hypothetical protein